jgi:DNA-binding CsgD family transcriptional regulator
MDGLLRAQMRRAKIVCTLGPSSSTPERIGELIDAGMNVVFHNRGARRTVSASPCVTLQGRRLTIGCPVDRAAMQAAGAAAIEHGKVTARKMHDLRGATSAFCRVLPLPVGGDERPQTRLALIVCRSADVAPEQIRAVCELYGLSQAECRVVELLAGGANPQAIASVLNCSIHTVRAHLKQIFYKTNTTRQSELVALVRTAVP